MSCPKPRPGTNRDGTAWAASFSTRSPPCCPASRPPGSFPQLTGFNERFEIDALCCPLPAVVFLVRAEEIRVLAVAHAKRRPGYC